MSGEVLEENGHFGRLSGNSINGKGVNNLGRAEREDDFIILENWELSLSVGQASQCLRGFRRLNLSAGGPKAQNRRYFDQNLSKSPEQIVIDLKKLTFLWLCC